jgi:hypothetical protein
MTNERMTNKPGEESDALVSETYREIARENVPESLDNAVLKAAAKAARPRYSRSIAWTRPAAWAATITLSVALVLELTREPTPQPATTRAVLPGSAAEPAAASGAEQRDDTSRLELEESDGVAKRERAPSASENFAPSDADMLRQAEEMARTQEGQSDQPATVVPAAKSRLAPAAAAFELSSKSSLDSAAMASDEISTCDAAQIADPESWLECIRELEAVGLTDPANEQRALLAEAFPDFDIR